MDAACLFSLTFNLVTRMTSQVFKEEAQSIRGVKQELDKLQETINTIQAVLLDAEKKQSVSDGVQNWIKRLTDVLYEADDLLDEVATDALLKQQVRKENALLKKVRIVSKLNSIIFSDNFAKKVKAVRKSLDEISKDMDQFEFVSSPYEKQNSGSKQTQDACSVVDKEVVIGRVSDKKAILDFLFDKSHAKGQRVSVIAIAGIGGIGKTTLAKLVYSDEAVGMNFERRYWANISRICDEKEILEKIFACISMNSRYRNFTISELYSAIKESMNSTRNYLFVLDDVWNENASSWFNIISLLGGGATGSKIVITTRSSSVAKAVDAAQIYKLNGLTEDESWKLFKRVAFQPEQENDLRLISLGREIVNRCNGVPLAIKSIASLLSTKVTTEEWQSVINEKKLFADDVMSVLELSYAELPPTLKPCLAYCSLFPKDHVFEIEELIYLWISQGYVTSMPDGKPVEEVGREYFLELLSRSYFHEAVVDEYGEVVSCKMHDLIHDLVQNVARHESIMITNQFSQKHEKIRHLSVGAENDGSWNIPLSLFQDDGLRVRSVLFFCESSLSPLVLDELLTKFKHLRALNLGHQKIEVVPDSIKELVHLRYLNLSHNDFTCLPDAITLLVNLRTLNISWCERLELLPDKFQKLHNLRHLDTKGCYSLRYMPPGFEELTSLQCLSFFKVGKVMDDSNSRLNALAKLKLKGDLQIKFDEDMDCDEEEGRQLPVDIRELTINNYPGMRVPFLLSNLVSLYIGQSSKIKQILPFRHLLSLKNLHLSNLEQLEYIENEEDENESGQSAPAAADNALFFPCLNVLTLEGLPKLKGWSKEVESAFTSQGTAAQVTEHPSCTSLVILKLTVRKCQEFKFMPLCPHLKTLELNGVNEKLIQQLLTTPSTTSSSSLETIAIWDCDLLSFPGETSRSLYHLEISFCDKLKNLYLAPPEFNTLQELLIQSCPELELWEEEKRGVDWDSFPNLRNLKVIGMPNPEELPDCLQQRQSLGEIFINME